MSDDPADRLQRFNTVQVPMVLVPRGHDPGEIVRGAGFLDPVCLPVRIEPSRSEGPIAGQTPSGQSGAGHPANAASTGASGAEGEDTAGVSIDPNFPADVSGRRPLVPRRRRPAR